MSNKDIVSHGKSTQFGQPNGNDPTKGGRNQSIRKSITNILEANGALNIPSDQVIKVNDDGSVDIKVPTDLAIATKLYDLAFSKSGGDSLKAIQMLIEQIDGKPTQKLTTDDERGGDAAIGLTPEQLAGAVELLMNPEKYPKIVINGVNII